MASALHLEYGSDPVLVKALVRGQDWWQRWSCGEAGSLSELAESEGIQLPYVRRLVRLAFLAPDIKRAILEGTQPIELTAERLTRLEDLPSDWADQRQLLGFN